MRSKIILQKSGLTALSFPLNDQKRAYARFFCLRFIDFEDFQNIAIYRIITSGVEKWK